MYSDENYFWGIVAYYLGSVLVLLFMWRFRELLPGRHFRNQLLMLLASVMLVPIKAYPDMGYLAPAWFVSLFEGLTGTTEMGFLRGAQPILLCYLALSFLYLVGYILSRVARRSADGKSDPSLSPD